MRSQGGTPRTQHRSSNGDSNDSPRDLAASVPLKPHHVICYDHNGARPLQLGVGSNDGLGSVRARQLRTGVQSDSQYWYVVDNVGGCIHSRGMACYVQ